MKFRKSLLGILSGAFLAVLLVPVASASAASLTLSVPGSIQLDITPTIESKLYKANPASIAVKTDALAGYSLSLKSNSDNVLKNGAHVLNSIASPISETAFSTDAQYDGQWGYSPSVLNGSANAQFIAGPTAVATVLETTAEKNDAEKTYDLTIAAKIDQTFVAGTYANTFVVTAMANEVPYKITYNLNHGSNGPTPNPQTGKTLAGSVNISATEPTRAGYKFLGWCDMTPTSAADKDSCAGKTYVAGQAYILTGPTNDLVLHAMWGLVPMQEFDCSTLTLSEANRTATLIDTRDDNIYTVAKLDDGKCWMTQNLRITGKTVYSANSDMTSGSYEIPASNLDQFDTNLEDMSNEATYYNGDENYGAHYTWQVATAGTGINYTAEGQNVPSSICPKGWKLPTGGSDTASSDFGKLVTAYGGNNAAGNAALRDYPYPHFVYAGIVTYSDSLTDPDVGSYWSSTVYVPATAGASTAAYSFVIGHNDGGVADPAAHGYRMRGASVRCVAREK